MQPWNEIIKKWEYAKNNVPLPILSAPLKQEQDNMEKEWGVKENPWKIKPDCWNKKFNWKIGKIKKNKILQANKNDSSTAWIPVGHLGPLH